MAPDGQPCPARDRLWRIAQRRVPGHYVGGAPLEDHGAQEFGRCPRRRGCPLLVAVASQWLPAQAIFGVSAALAVLGAVIALVVLRDRFGRNGEAGILATSAWELEPELAEAGAVG